MTYSNMKAKAKTTTALPTARDLIKVMIREYEKILRTEGYWEDTHGRAALHGERNAMSSTVRTLKEILART